MLHPMQRYNLENISVDNNNTPAKILQSSLYLKQAGSAPKLFNRKPALKKNQFNESSSSQLTNLGPNQSLLSNLSQNAYDIPRNKGAHSFSTSNKYPTQSLNPYLPLQPTSSTKSNANLHLSTSAGQMPVITQSQSTTYFQGQVTQQKNLLNNSRGSISFASKGGNSTTLAGASTAKRSFYHHSNIFNLKQYKNLTGYIMDGADIDEVKNQQRSLLIREFRQRVGQYLLLSKYRKDQATRDFNGYYTRIQGQLFTNSSNSNFSMHNTNNNNDPMAAGAANRTKISQSNGKNNNGISFFSSVGMQNQQQLQSDDPNQSLSIIQQNNQGELNRSMLNIDANRFNYSKLSKQEASLINNMSIDIYLEDTAGHKSSLNAAHRFDHSKLQEMILDKLAPLIPNDIEYDQKIEKYTREYDRILQKIQNKSFTIKVPTYYEPQMQPFNEFYSIDYSKKKNQKEEEIPWNEINEQVINQVLEQDDMEQEEQEEDEPEESEEEEMEIEVEKEEIEEKEPEEDIPIKSRRSQKNTTDLAVVGTEIKTIQKVVKVAKKKKKKNIDIHMDLQHEETKQDGEEQPYDDEQNQQHKDNYDSQVNTPKGVQKRERKPGQGKERSAMEEYLIFRPTSPAAAPKKPRKKEESTVIKKQAAPIKKVATPAAKTQIPSIQIPNSSQKESSPKSKADSRSQSNREESPKKESEINDNLEPEEIKVITVQEKPVIKEVISVKEPVGTPKAKDQKKEVTIGQPVNEVIVQEQIKNNNPNPIPVVAPPVPNVQQPASSVPIVQPKTQTPTQLAPPQITSTAPVQPKSSFKQAQVPIYSPRPKEPEENKKNDDEDDEDEEDDEEAEVPERKQSTVATPKQKGVTPRNKTNSSANDDKQQSDNAYYNQIVAKKRIGTGLIDELVKINYLLDFNVNSFKKDRRAPELPRELEFKGDEDRLLFDSIFQWQYEVDLDIEEMEEKLNVATTHRKHYDSDEDDDEHYQGKSKGSVHSSEITDFGPAPPLRTDMQDLDGDDDDQFSDQDD